MSNYDRVPDSTLAAYTRENFVTYTNEVRTMARELQERRAAERLNDQNPSDQWDWMCNP